jgi:hypothetical protein
VVTATIPGADAKLKEEEIAFSCHLDHQRPGANDNASGCVTILEVARTLQKLINEGKLTRPARTIRFIFPPEIEGTMALLNGKPMQFETRSIDYTGGKTTQLPPSEIHASVSVFSGAELAKRIKAVVHMDMVGGGPETKAVFHVTRGPMSLPSFVHDVAWAFAEFVNEESYEFAATGKAAYPLVAPEGGKEPLRAEYSAYTMGSDHDVYQDSSFGIPAIYLNDWPDRYIHTNFDTAANIDPTKLKRAAFIGAASGYFLANLQDANAEPLIGLFEKGRYRRVSQALTRREALYEEDLGHFTRFWTRVEQGVGDSLLPFLSRKVTEGLHVYYGVSFMGNTLNPWKALSRIPRGDELLTFQRKTEPKGPLTVFGYDYFVERAKAAGVATPKLLGYEGLWGAGEEYAYEVLNFADGKRNAQEIRDAVSAEYGPVPLELVVEYLRALEKIGVVEQAK